MPESSPIDVVRGAYRASCLLLFAWAIARVAWVSYPRQPNKIAAPAQTSAVAPAIQPPVEAPRKSPKPSVARAPASAQSSNTVSNETPAPTPESRPTYKKMHLAPKDGQPQSFMFFLEECHHSTNSIICTGNITNTTDEVFDFGLVWQGLLFVDDKQNTLIGEFRLSNGSNHEDLLPNVPISYTLTIAEPHSGVNALTLRISGGRYRFPDDMMFYQVPVQ